MKRKLAAVTILAILLSGCGAAREDRPDSEGGAEPDTFGDAKKVIVYRNVNNVPNIAMFCLGEYRFWSTLRVDRSGIAGGRMPEQDAMCGSQ